MNAHQLRPADLADSAIHLRLPLQLCLNDVGTITLERLIYFDPIGHYVAIASHGDKVCLVKMWRYASYRNKPWSQDQQALTKAEKRGARTLQFYFETTATHLPLRVLGYQLERPTCSLHEAWASAENDTDRQQILIGVLDLLAQLHESGVEVAEFCMHDYLQVQGSWAVITGERLRCMPVNTTVRDLPSLEAVAGLFSAIGHFESDRLRYLVGEYYRARGWAPHRVNDAFERAYTRQYNRVKQQFLRDFSIAGGQFREFYHPRVQALVSPAHCTAGLGVLLDDPAMALASGKPVMQVDPSRLAQVDIEGTKLWLHQFSNPEAMHHAWRAYALMQLAGIPTAKPTGRVELMTGMGGGESYLLTETIRGTSLAQQLKRKSSLPVPDQVVTLLERMVANDLTHGCLTTDRMMQANDQWYFVRAYNLSDRAEGLRAKQVADLSRFIESWPVKHRSTLIHRLQQSKWLSPIVDAVLQQGVA